MSQPHLQIFAPSPVIDKELSFTLFPLLPQEVRFDIWRHALQHERIIKVHLESPPSPAVVVRGSAEFESYSNNRQYSAVVDGYQVLSKLLRVNSESREETLRFYRVRLPCVLTKSSEIGDEIRKVGTLLVNPEYDFLKITAHSPMKHTLVDFLYRMKVTYDPRHVGLLNLAMDLNDLKANDLYQLELSQLGSEVRIAFAETIAQLHEVIFVDISRAGRQIVGRRSGLPTSETIFNRSFPIMAASPTFERLRRDPRPIAPDLKKLFLKTFRPQPMFDIWKRLLSQWNISPPQVEYRFSLAFDAGATGDWIHDRESAERYLQDEDNDWRGIPRENGAIESSFSKIKFPVGAESEEYRHEDLNKAVRPAFGFWLFPGLPESKDSWGIWTHSYDMSEHWPELALTNLP